MLQGEDVVAVETGDVADARAGTTPQLSEAAVSRRSGAVQEDQRRPATAQLARRQEVAAFGGRAAVESGAGRELTFDLVGDEVGDLAGDIDAQYLQASNDPVPHATAFTAKRQLRGDFQHLRPGGVAAGFQPEVNSQVLDTRP